MGRHVIAISSTENEEHGLLPHAREQLKRFCEKFESSITLDSPISLIKGQPHHEIQKKVQQFLSQSEGEFLLLIWSGHGVRDGDHFLVCQNTPKTEVTSFNSIRSGAVSYTHLTLPTKA